MSLSRCGHLGVDLLALSVGAGGVVSLVDDEVLGTVVVSAGEVAVEDGKGTVGVALLGVEGGTGHVGHHGVSTTEGVLGVAQRVVLGGGLREPDITTVSTEVAGLEGGGDILLDDDGTTGGVDEPRSWGVGVSKCGAGRSVGLGDDIPGFILAIRSLLNRPRVFSWRGQLMVTTSHWANISSRVSTLRQPISFSTSGLRGW